MGTGIRALLILLFATKAFGWGGQGHQIIALIAESQLTPEAKAAITELLGADVNISDAEIANWADQVRRERRETAPWHFVNIPIDAEGYDPARDGKGGDNVVDQIERFKLVLADESATKEQRAEALKFIVHFVGDIHQPLHCGDRGDRGGNTRLVFFLEQRKAVPLHRVWDTLILTRSVGETPVADYADKLEAQIKADDVKTWQSSGPREWVNEGHALARESVYKDVPADGDPPKIGTEYVAANQPVIDRQLLKAGVRLAAVLNEVLK